MQGVGGDDWLEIGRSKVGENPFLPCGSISGTRSTCVKPEGQRLPLVFFVDLSSLFGHIELVKFLVFHFHL